MSPADPKDRYQGCFSKTGSTLVIKCWSFLNAIVFCSPRAVSTEAALCFATARLFVPVEARVHVLMKAIVCPPPPTPPPPLRE